MTKKLLIILILFNGLCFFAQDSTTTYDGFTNRGILIKNKKQGVWFSYDDKKRLCAKKTYANDILNGPSTTFQYRSADTLVSEGNYINGLPAGTWTQNSGRHKTIIEYSANKNSKTTTYVRGKIAFVNFYNDKTPIGIWLRYDNNGVKKREIPHKKGKVDGKVITYYPNGKILSETIFIDGQEKETKCWDNVGILDKECKNLTKGITFPFD